MKRFLTIVMLFLFLLNVLGYYGIFIGLRLKNVQELVQKLDSDAYLESETITFEIPITVPYSTESRDFERVDGEFEHNGEVYRLVKQRLSADTLYIVCVKDHRSDQIDQVLDDYVKSFSDKPVNTKQSTKSLQLIKDYISFAVTIDHHSTGWQRVANYSLCAGNFIPSFFPSVIHPPERA